MDAVSEVKSRLSIEDVVSEYVQLKRAGKNFKGLSPFTSERTPSFVVSPEKQIWHDFSSGRGGDMFTFVQEVEGLDFKGTLELLARKAGVDLSKFQTSGKSSGPSKERLYQILEATALFYQKRFKENNDALEYIFKKRAYTKDTVLKFQIGYSPEAPKDLTSHLLKAKFTLNELQAAGVSVERRGTIGDMFRGRIMIPLHDPVGRVIGFTARILKDVEGAPKYINTPSTPLYDKSRHIYGLHLAKKSIQKNDFSVMVEGNLDVIGSHQAGVENVVATAGTALTEMQLKSLQRLASGVKLAFDQDKAGIAAAERALPIARKVGVDLKIITIPNGKDPDELVRTDVKLWEKAIEDSIPAFDWLIKTYQTKYDMNSSLGKRTLTNALLNNIKLLEPVEQVHYLEKLAELTGAELHDLRQQLREVDNNSQQRKKEIKFEPGKDTNETIEDRRAEEHFLGIMLEKPETRNYLDLVSAPMFKGSESRKLVEFLQANRTFSGDATTEAELKDISDYVKILSLQFEELYGKDDLTELQYEAAHLRAKVIKHFVTKQNEIIKRKLKGASKEEENTLLVHQNKLNQLLNRTKE